jgi:glycosyltransferase involved in cell wall biosynthesis
LKIAFLITRGDDIGGAQIHVRDLSLAYSERGFEVVVLVGQKGFFSEVLSENGIQCKILKYLVRPINPFNDILVIKEIYMSLKELKPDLLSCHSSKAGLLGRIAGAAAGVPTIFTAHGWSFTNGVPYKRACVYRYAEKLVAPLGGRIITVSNYDKNLALKYQIGESEKIQTVHNGMPGISRELLSDPKLQPPKIIMIARFDEQKDHKTLLDALSKLKDLPWKMFFIGDGPFRTITEGIAKSKGLEERVVFLGKRNDVTEQLAKAQMFVLSTNWEGFPRSILEAMRAGLPVIATDVGGVGEAIVDGKNGFLTPKGDVEALRKHLFNLIVNPKLRMTMGREGQNRFEQNFTFEKMLEKTLDIYNEYLGFYPEPKI